MDPVIAKYRNRHKRCKYCKYYKYHALPVMFQNADYYFCEAKDKMIEFESFPRPFCSCFSLKED